MNIIRLSLILFFLGFLNATRLNADILRDDMEIVQSQVAKVIDKKKIIHRSPVEFKQMVARYIKNTDLICIQNTPRNSDEKSAYKKELHYLFKNYTKFSATTLLSRLRSAHYQMMKQETNLESETYQRYEQLCSALLLVCAHIFFNEVRNQLLQALYEVDNLLVYWHYQHNHQLSYFFGKSPLKWVMGKKQAQEIVYNINKLERKQKELYSLLGSLMGHAYLFNEIGNTYTDCYTWIDQLVKKVNCIKATSYLDGDGSVFDEVSSQLEAKLKRVNKCKVDCLASIVSAHKPNHFVSHWIRYTALLAATGYLIHYNSKNPQIMSTVINGIQTEASKFLILLLHPLQKIYERGKVAFSSEEKKDKEKNQHQDNENDEVDLASQWMEVRAKIKTDRVKNISVPDDQLKVMQEMIKKADPKTKKNIEQALSRIENTLAQQSTINEEQIVEFQSALSDIESFVLEAQLLELIDKDIELGKQADMEIAEQLAKNLTSIRQDGISHILASIEKVKKPIAGLFYGESKATTFERFDENELRVALERIEIIVEPIKDKETGLVINQNEVERYQKDLKYISDYTADAIGQISQATDDGRLLVAQLGLGLGVIRMDDDILNVLHKYTIIIDGKIIPLFDVAAQIVENIGIQAIGLIRLANGLIKKANDLERDAHKQLKSAEQQLKDHELTLMFTSLIPLGIMALGVSKLYQWATTRNYSPIRLALCEINSLLIEAANHLDDQAYGKLVYLIYQLRHKSTYLKDILTQEFLDDVTKLESRQYSAQLKREMITNMFNKYTFLGKITA